MHARLPARRDPDEGLRAGLLAQAPDGFKSKPWRGKDLPGKQLAIAVSPLDCTGCKLCVTACPAFSKTEPGHRSLEMHPAEAEQRARRARLGVLPFGLPELDRTLVEPASIKGSQLLEPLFEFSGACSGCGETPYLKLLTQLVGDRLVVANATGCSSIYGGNLPTTPWACNADGRGPAWANSLFEDNAEFGLGICVSASTSNGARRSRSSSGSTCRPRSRTACASRSPTRRPCNARGRWSRS